MMSAFNTPLLVEIQVQIETKNTNRNTSTSPVRSTLNTLLLVEAEQLLRVELLPTAATHVRLWEEIVRVRVQSSRLRCWFNVFQRPCGWGHVVQDLLRSRNSEKGKLSLVNLKSAGASSKHFRTCIWKKSYDGTNLTTLKTFRTGVTVLGADMAHLMENMRLFSFLGFPMKLEI